MGVETATVLLSSDPASDEVLLGLADDQGLVGWGPLPSPDAPEAAPLHGLRVALLDERAVPGAPVSLRRALEQAALDLLARRAGRPLAAFLGEAAASRVRTHVRVADPAGVRAMLARGLSRFEVALGAGSLAEEDYRIARVRARAGREAEVGLDAASARWDAVDARRGLEKLAAHRPSWVIDPLPRDAVGSLAASGVALLVEAAGSGPRWVESDAPPPPPGVGVVVRPEATGLAAGRRLLSRARAAGRAAFVATAARGAVGLLGALHLAASVPGTGLLLRSPLSALRAALVDEGDLRVGEAPGVGDVP